MSSLEKAIQELSDESNSLDHKVIQLQSQITILRSRKETLRDAAEGLKQIAATLAETADFGTPATVNVVEPLEDDLDNVMDLGDVDLDDTQEV